jgi:hypothetical protein
MNRDVRSLAFIAVAAMVVGLAAIPSGSAAAPAPIVTVVRLAYLRAHPFKGTCPTAYDGAESTYRFRGFETALPSCTYDLSGVEAVRLTNRLLATLKPRA